VGRCRSSDGPDQPDDDRHTGDGNRNRRRLRMSDSADHGDIEQDQTGCGYSGQPEPFGPARPADSHPGNARDQR
jgi:hypothetical protein